MEVMIAWISKLLIGLNEMLQGTMPCSTLEFRYYNNGLPNMVPGPAASAGNLLEMQILRPTPDLVRVGPALCILTSPIGDSESHRS